MRFSTLEEWLAWQEGLHPKAIDLGLERVGRVAGELELLPMASPVITVAGTNGKGSSVAMLEAILKAAGHRVGSYTSPHLLRYNERIRIDGEPVSDAVLCAAFGRVDDARGEHSLSYFEFGTLAALLILARAELDVMVLEVGLGGRLDAVNVVDADVALVTTVDIDHVAWLGNDRETIGREKAGIFRPGSAAVCGDVAPPVSVRLHAESLGAHWYGLGEQFGFEQMDDRWHWVGLEQTYQNLPLPQLPGAHQTVNAAAVLQALECLQARVQVSQAAIETGLQQVQLPGRFQRIPGPVERVYDVAHNAQGGRALAQTLTRFPVAGRTRVVLGMLDDKDVAGFVEPLLTVTDHWYVGGLAVSRGLDSQSLAASLADLVTEAHMHQAPTVAEAYALAMKAANPGDRVLVCGSFYTVAEVIGADAVN